MNTERDVRLVIESLERIELQLQVIHEHQHRILMTQVELAAALALETTQIGKIAKEQSDRFDALTKQIADLNAVIAAGGTVSQEVVDAQAAVQTALDNLDASIPDAPAPAPAA